MNLQESIRRILREEDFIPLESLNLVIEDYEDGFDVYIMGEDKKIGEISFTKEDKPNQYTIVDATIDDEYKGNRIYPKTIIKLFKEKPNIIINSVFRSPEAEKAWKYLLSDLPSNIEKKIKHYKEENTTLYQLKLKNLQESIRRILREESLRDTLISEIEENGFLSTCNLVGGLSELLQLLGEEYLTDHYKIKLIKEIVLTTDDEYITFLDMNENPLLIEDDGEVISQIEMLHTTDVLVTYFEKQTGIDLGDYYLTYEVLNEDVLDDIFNMVVNYYIDELS
jgi:hypothetical protein